MHTVKEIAGGDSRKHRVVTVTSIMSVNALSHQTIQYKTRRVVVVPTVATRDSEQRHFIGELIAPSLATRFKYDMKPPVTVRALLMTLFQAKFIHALSIVHIDEHASVLECYYAIRLLCHEFNLDERVLLGCISFVGYCCCIKFGGVCLIMSVTVRHKSKIWSELPTPNDNRSK